jgi:hypothetical protein
MTPLDTMLFRGAPSGQRNSAIAAMSTRGVEDFCLVEGPVNGAIILEFVQNSLVSIVKPFNVENDQSIVIINHASIHPIDGVLHLISSTGALLWFLPTYTVLI